MADVAVPEPQSQASSSPAEPPKTTEPAAAATSVDEDSPPDWLTADFLQDVLTNSDGEDDAGENEAAVVVRVTGFEAEPAVGKGDNYASLMLRVRVHVVEKATASGEEREGQRSVVVKCLPANEMARGWVEKTDFFPREQRMYRETLPRMQRLLDQHVRSTPFARLAPRALSSHSHGIIVLEDLRERGFKMVRRQSGLDLTHCLLVMRGLGTLHALSVALRESDPASVLWEEPFYAEKGREDFQSYLPRCFETLSTQVEKWTGFEHYSAKLLQFSKNIFDDILNIMAKTEEKFKVLNHGDCWVNNVLFKYSEETGEPIDFRFIDFQMGRYASMAMDLHYFLFSSPRKDIRTEKMDDMLSAYHTTFLQVLKELDCEEHGVTWEELQREVRRVMPFGLLSACNLLSIVVANPGEGLEFDNMTEEDILSGEVDIFAKALSGENYKRAFLPLLPYFESQGAL